MSACSVRFLCVCAQCSAEEEVCILAKHGRLDEALHLSKAVVNGPRAVRNPEFYRLVMHCYVQLLLELPNDDEKREKLLADFQ